MIIAILRVSLRMRAPNALKQDARDSILMGKNMRKLEELPSSPISDPSPNSLQMKLTSSCCMHDLSGSSGKEEIVLILPKRSGLEI